MECISLWLPGIVSHDWYIIDQYIEKFIAASSVLHELHLESADFYIK